jgi:hypothetical protein
MSKAIDRLHGLLGEGGAPLGESGGAGDIRGWIYKDYVLFKGRVTRLDQWGDGLSLAAVEDTMHGVRSVSARFANSAKGSIGQFGGTGAGFAQQVPGVKSALFVGVRLTSPRGVDALEKSAEIAAAMKRAGCVDVVVDGR